MATLLRSIDGGWAPELASDIIHSRVDTRIPHSDWQLYRLDAALNRQVPSVQGALERARAAGHTWLTARMRFASYADGRGQQGVTWANSRRQVVLYDKERELAHHRHPLRDQARGILRLEARLRRHSTITRTTGCHRAGDVLPSTADQLTQPYEHIFQLTQGDEDRRIASLLAACGWRKAAVLIALPYIGHLIPDSTLRRYRADERRAQHNAD